MLKVKNYKHFTVHTYTYTGKRIFSNFGFEVSYHEINTWMITFYLGLKTIRILKMEN